MALNLYVKLHCYITFFLNIILDLRNTVSTVVKNLIIYNIIFRRQLILPISRLIDIHGKTIYSVYKNIQDI